MGCDHLTWSTPFILYGTSARDTCKGGPWKGGKAFPQVPSLSLGIIVGLKWDGLGVYQ